MKDNMNKIKTTLNLSPEVFEMFKEQAREKGLDNGSYLTYLVHEKNKEKAFENKLKELFLDLLEQKKADIEEVKE